MNELHYSRIDAGESKDKTPNLPAPRVSGHYHSPEVKQKAIENALESLQAGETTEDIAERHGIPDRTLRSWLIADPRASQARAILVSDKLSQAISEMRDAKQSLPLARAREEFKAWAWIGERRCPDEFGPKQEVTHKGQIPVLSITIVSNSADPVDSLSPIPHIDVMSNQGELPNK